MFICNKCKRVFPDLEGYGMRLRYQFGYGSKYDGDMFDLTVCNECADTVAEAVEKICAYSPIVAVNEDALYGDDLESYMDDDDESDPKIFS